MEAALVTRTAMITGLEVTFCPANAASEEPRTSYLQHRVDYLTSTRSQTREKSKVEALIASLDAIAVSSFQ
jgi:hypothetical protein